MSWAAGGFSRPPEPPQTGPVTALGPLLSYIAQPRGGDQQLRLEARGKAAADGFVALSERAQKLAEFHPEREAVALVEVRDEDIVAAGWVRRLRPCAHVDTVRGLFLKTPEGALRSRGAFTPVENAAKLYP